MNDVSNFKDLGIPFATCEIAYDAYTAIRKGQDSESTLTVCTDPFYGQYYTEACPVTCDTCGANSCSFEETCFDDDVSFQEQFAFTRASNGKYNSCREAADYEPNFCVQLKAESVGFDNFFDACVDWFNKTSVDPLTSVFGKYCQQSCGPSPECGRRLRSIELATVSAPSSTVCRACMCEAAMCHRKTTGDPLALCKQITCNSIGATETVFAARDVPFNAETLVMEGVGLRNVSALILPSIRRVSVANNVITSIPAAAFYFPKLEFLHLEHNRITSLPDNIMIVSVNVITFDASHNHLSNVPSAMFQPCKGSIRRILLNNNKLSSLDPSLFRDLISLHHIKIHNNEITSLNEGMFANTGRLKLISANDNKISKISRKTFTGLTRLHTLSMARNRLTELAGGVFRDLTALMNLHIDDNAITNVGPKVFPRGPIVNYIGLIYGVSSNTTQQLLRTLSMRYNPTTCWAGMQRANDDRHTVNIFNDFNVQCSCAAGMGHDGIDKASCIPRKCSRVPEAAMLGQDFKLLPAACTGNSYADTCTLKCKAGYGTDQVTYTCNSAGEWVSDDVIECSTTNIVEVKPVVISERFKLPVPGYITRVGFDFEGSTYESKACVQHIIAGGKFPLFFRSCCQPISSTDSS